MNLTTEDDPAPADNVMSGGNCGLYDYINKEYTDITVKWALTANDERMVILSQFSVMVLWEMLISRKTM